MVSSFSLTEDTPMVRVILCADVSFGMIDPSVKSLLHCKGNDQAEL